MKNKISYDEFYKYMHAHISLKEKNVLQSVLNHELDNKKLKTIQPYEMNKIKSDILNYISGFEKE
jgi:hypothetical protein